jgi:TM2 domain-containing membrane protein YozV
MSASPAPLAATCPYCRAPFAPGEELTTCPACNTPHHADCFTENGGCTVFGCSQAPSDEPKISVTSNDLGTPASPGLPPPANLHTPTPPPPRPPGAPPPPPVSPAYHREDSTRYLTPPRHFSFGGYSGPISPLVQPYPIRKSRMVYVLLGVFLGAFGGHNFYAGYIKRAVIQLSISVFTCFVAAPVSWIWAIIEICIVNVDDDGVTFS